jgi:hypothetical protein
MTTIIIDRAVVEQALEALEAGPDVDPIFAGETEAALRAALAETQEPDLWSAGYEAGYAAGMAERPAEPVQEPVAWRWGYRSVTTGEMDWRGYVEIAAHPNLRSPAIIMEPLYAVPPQRKPLLASEIVTMYDESPKGDSDMIAFARAIEAAHGIKEGT